MGELDRLVWADSFTVELDGFAYELRGTSASFVRSAAGRVHLPVVESAPAVVYSAVIQSGAFRRTPVLSLYLGCHAIFRTLSSEMLLQAFLAELRTRALSCATDRVYVKAPAIRAGGVGVLLPASAARRFVRVERAAARVGLELTSTAGLVLELGDGRPVHEFVPAGDGRNGARIESVDAIAVARTAAGRLPSRAEVLFDLAQRTPNLSSIGGRGLDALGSMVERAELIEWNESRPDSMLKLLTGVPVSTKRAG